MLRGVAKATSSGLPPNFTASSHTCCSDSRTEMGIGPMVRGEFDTSYLMIRWLCTQAMRRTRRRNRRDPKE